MPATDPYQLPGDPLHDAGFDVAGARADAIPEAARQRVAHGIDVPGGGRVLAGTASWTDPTITEGEVFYPAGVRTPEQRLRFYASRFPLVEVDSTYYALPTRQMAEAWATRTPAGFTFDVKAHALMTGQPTEVSRLPRDLRESLPAELAGKAKLYPHHLPGELLDEVWARFRDALAPLRDAGKLGAVLLQYPRWVVPSKESAALITDARRRLGDDQGAVELRNHRWFETPRRSQRVLEFLLDHGLAHVMVDGPQGLESSVPRVVATTSPALALVRLHGRRDDLWERPRVPTVQRYRWLYDPDQLAEWVQPVLEVSREAKRVHVLLNNCYGNYGTTNAVELGAMLAENAGQPEARRVSCVM